MAAVPVVCEAKYT